MPDDNLIVWDVLWPNLPGGSVTVPFHFVLFSQGGVLVALVGSLVVGALLALLWQLALPLDTPTVDDSVMAGLVVLFGALIALDSLRNSVVSSYGMIWPAALLVALRFAGHLFSGTQVTPRERTAATQ